AALDDASVACTYGRDLAALEPLVWHARGLGDFWQHALVAEGSLDAAVDARLALWDYAAPALIVAEAGGRASARDGGPPRPRPPKWRTVRRSCFPARVVAIPDTTRRSNVHPRSGGSRTTVPRALCGTQPARSHSAR